MRKKRTIFLLFVFVISLFLISKNIFFSKTNIKGAKIEPSITQASIPTYTPTPTDVPPTSTPTPMPTNTPTPTPTPFPIILSPYLDEFFTRYCNQYNVDKQLLARIANCESHFGTGAQSADGKYGGMFQFDEGTWTKARNAMRQSPDLNLRFGAPESIETAAFWIKGHPNAWPNCGI